MAVKLKCFRTERKLLESKGDNATKTFTIDYFPLSHSDS
jgi:hypothetical protein